MSLLDLFVGKNSPFMRISMLLATGLLIACSSVKNTSNDESPKKTSLCNVVENVTSFEGLSVSMSVFAQAAFHDFDVALSDSSCPGKSIFLSAKAEFENDPSFISALKKMYPDFPSDDRGVDDKIHVDVIGTVIHKKIGIC